MTEAADTAWEASDLRVARLSRMAGPERSDLLDRYRAQVYEPAFPDAEIREHPDYWLGLLAAVPYPPPPQPRIEVVVLRGSDEAVAGGVTVEYYRSAGVGLLTYIAVAQSRRGQGIARRLVAEARGALAHMAGGGVALFAETERLDDAEDEAARDATLARQRQLDRLGARLVDFDYWMPPLRPGLPPHQLHMMVFDTGAAAISAGVVAALLTELAAALGGDVDAHRETRAMMAQLAKTDRLPVRRLPAALQP